MNTLRNASSLATKFEENISGTIFSGDSLEVLEGFPEGSVGLIYADPPFFSSREYFLRESSVFSDRWAGGITEYLEMIYPRLKEFKRVLGSEGTIYLHCDYHASHYLKVLMDRVFGYGRFINEIVWKRQSAHCDVKQGSQRFGRIHDSILVYSKSEDYVWNQLFAPYDPSYVKKYYRFAEKQTGRRFALGDLTAPGGFGNRNPNYEFLGIRRYWRYSKENMRKLEEEGRIYDAGPGRVPKLKRYFDEMPGVPLQDIWTDVWGSSRKENWGFPTMKPVALLERIIQVSSHPGSLVLDPFCGSGTSLLAAHRLGRPWVGIDISRDAIRVSMRRLNAAGAKPKIS